MSISKPVVLVAVHTPGNADVVRPTTATWLRLCPTSRRRRRADAGEEVGAGVALYEPIADFGQTLRVGDRRQQLRQSPGTKARRRSSITRGKAKIRL